MVLSGFTFQITCFTHSSGRHFALRFWIIGTKSEAFRSGDPFSGMKNKEPRSPSKCKCSELLVPLFHYIL